MKFCQHPDCEHTRLVPCEGETEFCATRNAAIRKAERQASKPVKTPKPLKRTPIKKVSEKRAAELVEYKPLRNKFLQDRPNCEARLEVCTGRATDIHHKSVSALDFLNVETWLPVCRSCHIALENLPAEKRREMAFLVTVTERKTI